LINKYSRGVQPRHEFRTARQVTNKKTIRSTFRRFDDVDWLSAM
jgi:hypothetical protein